ncbi:MAG: hypothetical protein JWQ71_2957 [Pedosphaera sp.]|nr:hypothetical protein [Pedosphaera sp.]
MVIVRRFRTPSETKLPPLLLCLAGIISLLFMAGCVSVQRQQPHSSWPKPASARNIRQFEGVYLNHSLDAVTGEAKNTGYELFDYLTGRSHSQGGFGKQVELRVATDGNSMQVRLFDEQSRQIDSATLQRDTAFALSDGKLILHGPFSGLKDLNSNWGPGVKSQRYTLWLSATGDLLGIVSEKDVALLMDIIPSVGTAKQSMFWPKLDK